jgi:hypothetical protein
MSTTFITPSRQTENGGGGGGSVNIGPVTVVPAGLRGPWNWLAWSQYPNQQHLLTDLDILGMDPVNVVELYYDLLSYTKKTSQSWSQDCFVLEANPIISPGLTILEAEEYEGKLRDWLYTLRGDLHTITLADGRTVPGLVDLRHVPTRPPCSTTIAGEVFKWVIVAASSALTAGAGAAISVGMLVQNLAMAGLNLADQLRAAKAQLALIESITSGAYAIVGKQFQDALLGFGVNLLEYSEAVKIPTSAVAWELALSIGLPHPGMICAPQPSLWLPADPARSSFAYNCKVPFMENGAPCSPYCQAWFLLQLLARLKEKFALDLRRHVEDAVRFNGKWHLKNRLEIWTHHGLSLKAIVPEIFVVNGRPMVQDWVTGEYIDPTTQPELEAVATWLAVREHPEITAGIPDIYGAGSILGKLGAPIIGQYPPSPVLLAMQNSLPLAPPAVYGGREVAPFSVQSAPVNVVEIVAPGTPAALDQTPRITTIPFSPGVITSLPSPPVSAEATPLLPSQPRPTVPSQPPVGTGEPLNPQPSTINQQSAFTDIVEGGDPVLFWAIAIAGFLFSATTGKKKVRLF